MTNKFPIETNTMLYFISCAFVHYPRQKQGGGGRKNTVTEMKPSFLYKHRFATVHNYRICHSLQIAHQSDIGYTFFFVSRNAKVRWEATGRGKRMSLFQFSN